MGPLPFDLLLITDQRCAGGPSELVEACGRALRAGGSRVAVLLRDKDLPHEPRLALARALRAATDAHGSRLFVHAAHDRGGIARKVAADGIHLADGDESVGGPFGLSTHDARGLRRAAELGAAYACLGPVFTVPGKGMPLGWAAFGGLANEATLPVVALGGLGPEHVPDAHRHGADAIAVIRGVLAAPDPADATARYLEEFNRCGP